MTALLLAVDVGTEEARAAAFDEAGRLAAVATAPVPLLRPADGAAVYRMDAIWSAAGAAIRACLAGGPDLGMRVVGLGFAASPSLVLDAEGPAPLEEGANVLAWCDRRAEAEAQEMTLAGGASLAGTGGSVTPDRHLPRLLWLKRHSPAAFARLRAVRDLCDELTRRASGNDRHSLAALATRWPYQADLDDPWRHDAFAAAGLEEVWGLGALSGDPVPAGRRQGALRGDVAEFLGLPPGIPVAAGLPDSLAGLLGALGRNLPSRLGRTLAVVGGRSTALLALSAAPRDIPGIGGPWVDALFPSLFLHEAGQPCAGAALDLLLAHHPGGPGEVSATAHAETAADILACLDTEGPAFAARRHLVPDWCGTLSPWGDGTLRALVTGAGEDRTPRAFLETYYATARALALQLRHIAGHLAAHGLAAERVSLVGGQARNPLLRRLYRDAIGPDLVVCDHPEPVLLGAAMAAAVAAGVHPTLQNALDIMAPPQARLAPDPFWRRAHDAAYAIYRRLVEARDEAARAGNELARQERRA